MNKHLFHLPELGFRDDLHLTENHEQLHLGNLSLSDVVSCVGDVFGDLVLASLPFLK